MHAHRYKGSFGPQRPPFGRGRGRGSWEPMGPPRILPYLAAAFLLRAAMRGAFDRRGHRGHGPWGWDQPGTQYGPWGEGAPWRRGHRHEHHHGHGPGRGLRPEIGAIMGQLRGAFREGTLDGRKVDEIRAVLADAQKRIGAILAESGPRPTGSQPTEL